MTTLLFFIMFIRSDFIIKQVKIFCKNLKNGIINIKQLLFINIIGIIGTIIGTKIIEFVNIFLQTREFNTLGSRGEIWMYSIEYINNIVIPKIKVPTDLALNGVSYYNNTHNILLNEAIESGWIGALLFMGIFVYSIILQKNTKNKIIF